MNKYSSTTHTTYNIGYHVVFSPKYRYNLLRYKAADILKELIQKTTTELGISIPVMEVMPDHVHLFVVARPSLSIDKIVMRIKGYSSYIFGITFLIFNAIQACGHVPTSWKQLDTYRKRP